MDVATTSSSSQAAWTPAEEEAMRAALDAARTGQRGANPLVGAAVLAEGRVAALGWHRGAGAPHAEVEALAQARRAGNDLSRATVVVTLEPCHHHGRTGPCTQAILEAGVRRVVYATEDPTPRARGGAQALRRCGLSVVSGLLAREAASLNHRWLRAVAQDRPFVTAKVAQSLDGRTAAVDATSQWITGVQARAHAHQLRARCDAVLVGTGTLLADDPRLSARDPQGRDLPDQPLRVVMGTTEVPPGAALRSGRWCHLRTRDPHEALAQLAGQGVRHLLVEGGARVTTAFLAQDLVDSLVVYQAPLLLGAGAASVADIGVTTLTQARRLELDREPVRLGEDVLLELSPVERVPPAPAVPSVPA
ncbi:bifunctional diaminohydroxyphosphoribosylaminopyrimidine deaminase/5-amino-6-(5-phosphoribosylamino)uracil reductase RibD [Actinomyces lilanjuaniae]|nr:bifunctional diaminohydroxyphosphoribosylaminopyrimidine deaminase/5-amino-6-(5-phosphoribosylamino)uracil reductase RibD [Actinomyces lilanjuaniae]